jgi:hypothetical protein
MSDARVPAAVLELAHRLAQPRAMRRGWLSVRYLRCNRPGCRCAHRPEARHGPYTSVVRTSASTAGVANPSEHASPARPNCKSRELLARELRRPTKGPARTSGGTETREPSHEPREPSHEPREPSHEPREPS